MDPNSGKFHALDEDDAGNLVKKEDGEPIPKDWPVFTVGEELAFRGHRFRVDSVEDDKLVLTWSRSVLKTKTEKNQERRKRNKQRRKKKRK